MLFLASQTDQDLLKFFSFNSLMSEVNSKIILRNNIMGNTLRAAAMLVLLGPSALAAETLFSISDMVYQGATRIPIGTYGASRMGFTEGTFEISKDQSSVFMVGHAQHQAIAEFTIPEFSKADSVESLPRAINKQPFKLFLDQIPTGNPDNINRITGLKLVQGKLIANGVQYYDGDANNTDTTFVIEDPDRLESSPVTGFLKLQARAHASGWMTPLPARFHDIFGGNYIFGYASNYAINARNSMVPSAFSVNIDDILSASSGTTLTTHPIIDYSINNPLALDLYNKTGENDLWTEVSKAYIGLVVPGTETYAVFGVSGGHKSGIGYKITQDNGYQCGGPCPYESSDVYNYYWLFNLNDMSDVARGMKEQYEVKPYEYGEINFPFENQGGKPKLIIGASYNSSANNVYFLLGGADTLQNQYESAPLLLAYSIETLAVPAPPSHLTVD